MKCFLQYDSENSSMNWILLSKKHFAQQLRLLENIFAAFFWKYKKTLLTFLQKQNVILRFFGIV